MQFVRRETPNVLPHCNQLSEISLRRCFFVKCVIYITEGERAIYMSQMSVFRENGYATGTMKSSEDERPGLVSKNSFLTYLVCVGWQAFKVEGEIKSLPYLTREWKTRSAAMQ